MTLRLHITSLGPIKEGSIELGDVTVFIGPPNSGKSTALKALYYSLKFDRRVIKVDLVRREREKFEFKFDVNKAKEEYKKMVFEALPEGKFSLEPINVIKFLEENKLNFELKGTIPLKLEVLPSMCSEEEIKIIESFTHSNNVSYSGKVTGYEGYVEFKELRIPNLSEECSREVTSRLNDIITQNIRNEIESQIFEKLRDYFFAELNKRENIEGISFIPYWRSLPIYRYLILQEEREKFVGLLTKFIPLAVVYQIILTLFLDIEKISSSPPYLAELYETSKELNAEVLNLLSPLIPGNIKRTEDRVIYVENNKAISWRYVSASLMELMSTLFTIGRNELILYEEPETQLHEKLQLLMALFLYALPSLGNKVVITTHSQTIAYTLAHLAILKPNKEEISKLLDSLNVKNYEKLAEAIEKSNARNTSVRFYYFHDGLVKEKELKEVTAGMPGTIDVLEKELEWLSSLYQKRP